MAKYKVAGVTVVRIDNSAGTILDMTQYIDSITTVGKEVAPLEVTSFNDGAERFVAGIEMSEEVTVSGAFDDAATSGPDAGFPTLGGTINTIEYNPAGTVSGRRKITCEYLFVSYKVSSAVKERVNYELRARRDGTINATGTN
mgnify:CR=1 FL=1